MKELISIDKDLEGQKQLLSLKQDFNLKDLFMVFDVQQKGNVSMREFEEVYSLFQIYPNSDEIELVFKTYDLDFDGKLSFAEISEVFTPKDENYAALIHNRNQYQRDRASFQRDQPFTQ